MIGNVARRMFASTGRILIIFLGLLALKTAHFLIRVHHSAAVAGPTLKTEILERRDYLLQQVAPQEFSLEKMPSYIPDQFKEEWAIGTLSMTSAALTNIAFDYPETRERAVHAITQMIELMLSPELRKFELRAWGVDALDALENGRGQIGYLGHLNFMLSAHQLLGETERYSGLFRRITSTLARRMESAPSHYLETFPSAIFTADNMVVAASIANFDRVHGALHKDLLERWVASTKSQVVDKSSGLIPFYVDSDGRGAGVPRGSGTGWNSFYLPFVDPVFAAEQYALMKAHLVIRLPFGFSALREYLRGDTGGADIDSGPVILGLSTSGTGFGLAGARWHKDFELQAEILRTSEFVGSTVGGQGRRRYLLAPLVGDAIMLAMRTARPWNTRYLKLAGDMADREFE